MAMSGRSGAQAMEPMGLVCPGSDAPDQGRRRGWIRFLEPPVQNGTLLGCVKVSANDQIALGPIRSVAAQVRDIQSIVTLPQK